MRVWPSVQETRRRITIRWADVRTTSVASKEEVRGWKAAEADVSTPDLALAVPIPAPVAVPAAFPDPDPAAARLAAAPATLGLEIDTLLPSELDDSDRMLLEAGIAERSFEKRSSGWLRLVNGGVGE